MMQSSIAARLLAWFDTAGRKHLPWQQDITPYRVWVSEIMLQQTQVATVIPYYARFMQRFADVRALADAPIDEVLHLWTGLGYYARARNLHRAAQAIVKEHGGEFPCTLELVQSLPGIGRSTAGAILSIACRARHPILDGNVKRVLTRYFGVAGFPGEKRIEARLWELADSCTPHERVADYTQAIMDLGATVCTRTRPKCETCPISMECVAYRDNLQASLPTRRPKRLRPARKAFVLVATNADGAVLLERRPPSGIWGGLWTFPQFDREEDAMGQAAALRLFAPSPVVGAAPVHPCTCGICASCTAEGGGEGSPTLLPIYHHAFTHFDLELQPLVLNNATLNQVADSDKYCWYDPVNPSRIGLAKPVTDIIAQVTKLDRAV
jgi:A/G-specific adenine glycosylase